MYKEYLEQFLANQLTSMHNLRYNKDCLYRIYNQAFGACSFVSDCLFAAGSYDNEGEWLTKAWQDFQDKVYKEFKLDV